MDTVKKTRGIAYFMALCGMLRTEKRAIMETISPHFLTKWSSIPSEAKCIYKLSILSSVTLQWV